MVLNFIEKGGWNAVSRKFLNRSDEQTGSGVNLSMIKGGAIYDQDTYDNAVYASGGVISQSLWLDVYSNEIRLEISNDNADEDWILTALTMEYQIGSRQN